MANSSFTKGTLATPVPVASGGTGSTTQADARTALGLGTVAVESTVPITKGGTGLTSLGTSGQALKVNTGADGLEWGEAGAEGVSTYAASVSGYLTGGTSPSASTVFDSLGQGANNGKFKIISDGVTYDNVSVDLTFPGSESVGASQTSYNTAVTLNGTGQSFTTGASTRFITAVEIRINDSGGGGTVTANLYLTSPNGTLLATATNQVGTTNDYTKITFYTPVPVSPSTVYCFTVSSTMADANIRLNTGGYAGGAFWDGADFNATLDLMFRTYEAPYGASTTAGIAEKVQAAIQTATGGNEKCVYSTNKYVITSGTVGTTSSIARLESPSTGTDISGVGTAYLDCAANATPTAGSGNNGKVTLIGPDGKIYSDFIKAPSGYFGTGADGDVVLTGYTLLGANKQYNTLKIATGAIVEMNGYSIRVKGELINFGTIRSNGYPGSAGTAGTAGGAGGTGGLLGIGAISSGTFPAGRNGITGRDGVQQIAGNNPGLAGTAGINTTNRIGPAAINGTAGSASGGAGGAAGAAGTSTAESLYIKSDKSSTALTAGSVDSPLLIPVGSSSGATLTSSPGNGGSGSGGTQNSYPCASGGAGGSGGSGGIIFLAANILSNYGTIEAKGGNGGNAGAAAGSAGASGSGVGGGGGVIILCYSTLAAGTISVAGGTGGTTGNAGAAGTAGSIFKYQV